MQIKVTNSFQVQSQDCKELYIIQMFKYVSISTQQCKLQHQEADIRQIKIIGHKNLKIAKDKYIYTPVLFNEFYHQVHHLLSVSLYIEI